MKNILDTLKRTAETYTRLNIATVRQVMGEDDEELTHRGSILDKEKRPIRPIGMYLVVTNQPAKSIPVQVFDDGDAIPPDVLPYSALEELAGLVTFSKGRACVLWVNAGLPACLGAEALVNAARRVQTDLAREDAGQSLKPRAREIVWEQCKAVPVVNDLRGRIVWDWLKAAKDSEGEPQQFPSRSESTGDSSPQADSTSEPA